MINEEASSPIIPTSSSSSSFLAPAGRVVVKKPKEEEKPWKPGDWCWLLDEQDTNCNSAPVLALKEGTAVAGTASSKQSGSITYVRTHPHQQTQRGKRPPNLAETMSLQFSKIGKNGSALSNGDEKFLMFVRVLIQYLEQKDKSLFDAAKIVIKDCAERNKRREQGYESVTTAMQRRLKALVGEFYWKQADKYLLYISEQKPRQQQHRPGAAAPQDTTESARWEEEQWERMLYCLCTYLEQHQFRWRVLTEGEYPDEPRLASWAGVQRAQYHTQTLSRDRIQRLEAIGFVWTPPPRPPVAATTAVTTAATTTATKRKKGPTATSKLDATMNSDGKKKRRMMLAPTKEAVAETTKAEDKPVMTTVTPALAAAVTNVSSNLSSSVLQGNLSYNAKPRQHKNHQKSEKKSSFSSSKSSSAYDKNNTTLTVALTGNKYASSRHDKTINTKQMSVVLPKPSSVSSLCPSTSIAIQRHQTPDLATSNTQTASSTLYSITKRRNTMANNNGRQKGGGAAAGNSKMNEHVELTVKAEEDLYFSDSENTIRQVTAETNYFCIMLKTQRFSSLFRHYAKYHGLRKDDLEYYFVNPLENEDTPETVQYQRGDTIMVRKRRKVAITGNKYASSRNDKNINTKQTSVVLPKPSSVSSLCPSIAIQRHQAPDLATSNTQTASSILDKAWQLTSRVIALATKDIKAIATDDIFFLATRLFKAQEEFKTNKVPFRVDIAYHHTECKNLQTIRADGLLSKKERQKNGIASKYNGSKYGDGIYLSNDPIAYKKFGNTVIMVARLKGSTRAYEDGARFIASNDRDQNPKNNNKRSSNNCSGDGIINTIEVKNGRFCVVEQAKQCLPLYQIPSSNIRRPGFPNEAAKIALWTLADFQLKVQDVIDEILNNDEVAYQYICSSCGICPMKDVRYTIVEKDIDLCKECYAAGKAFAVNKNNNPSTEIVINEKLVSGLVCSDIKEMKAVSLPSFVTANDLNWNCHFNLKSNLQKPQQKCMQQQKSILKYTAPERIGIANIGDYLSRPSLTHTQLTKDKCSICLESIFNEGKVTGLVSCNCTFHTNCITKALEHHTRCPACRLQVNRNPRYGTMPSGTMTVTHDRSSSCAGYRNFKTIVIRYNIDSGIQKKYHPNPGIPFKAISRTAYVPDNNEGQDLVKRLQYAFNYGLLFCVGTSVTTGKHNVITWSSIHHKTNQQHGAHGFPDPSYIARCNLELDSCDVPPVDQLPLSKA